MQPGVGSGPASLYECVLAGAFASLHPSVQRAHLPPLVARGSFDVEHGTHPLTPLLIRLLRLPAFGRAQPVQLQVAVTADGVAWTRRIGTSVLRTVQYARGTGMMERNGPGRLSFELRVQDGTLEYRLVGMSIAHVPVPGFIRPHVGARVSPASSGWHVDVIVTWRNHLVCRYCGVMHAA